jgi:PAS domain S-box-containing protein
MRQSRIATTLKAKLLVGFFLLLLIVGAAFVIGLQGISSSREIMRDLVENHMRDYREISELEDDVNMVRVEFLTLIAEEDAGKRAVLRANIERLSHDIDKAFSRFMGHYAARADLAAPLTEARDEWNAFKETAERKILPAVAEGRAEDARRIATGVQRERYEKMLSVIRDFEERDLVAVEDHRREFDQKVRRVVLGYSLSFFLALCTASAIFILFSKNVVTPLKGLADTARAMTAGNYDQQPSVRRNSYEIKELADCFESMAGAITTREREKNELIEKISQASREWRDTFDSIADLIYITDGRFTVTKANRSFAAYCGLTPQEVIGKKCHQLFHGSDTAPRDCPHVASLKDRKMVQSDHVRGHSGKTFLLTAFPYFTQTGDILGSIVVGKDVTEEREKEMRLILSERLASLGQMASGIAHEINNPLAAIAGCTEGLMKRISQNRYDPELFTEYLRIIEEEIIRCKSITTSMLSFVRKATYDKREIQVNNILDKAVEVISFQGRLRAVELIKKIDPHLPPIRGSEGELRQVFLALVTNALDAMGDKGTLILETGREGDEGVFVKISDTGPGIPGETLSKIFDPFFTTKSDTGGTGLGLSIARKIVTNHNGHMEVVSDEGAGAAFKVILPAGASDSSPDYSA